MNRYNGVAVLFDTCWLMNMPNSKEWPSPLRDQFGEPTGINRDDNIEHDSNAGKLKPRISLVHLFLPHEVKVELANHLANPDKKNDAKRGQVFCAKLMGFINLEQPSLMELECPVLYESVLGPDSDIDKKIITLAKKLASENLVFIATHDGGIQTEIALIRAKENKPIYSPCSMKEFESHFAKLSNDIRRVWQTKRAELCDVHSSFEDITYNYNSISILFDTCWLMNIPKSKEEWPVPLLHKLDRPPDINIDNNIKHILDWWELKTELFPVRLLLPHEVKIELASHFSDPDTVINAKRGRTFCAELMNIPDLGQPSLMELELPVLHENVLGPNSGIDKKIIALAKKLSSESLVFIASHDGGIQVEIALIRAKENRPIYSPCSIKEFECVVTDCLKKFKNVDNDISIKEKNRVERTNLIIKDVGLIIARVLGL